MYIYLSLGLPAMDQYRVITSPPLNFGHLFYYNSDTAEVGAVAVRGPVGDVQLYHFVDIP